MASITQKEFNVILRVHDFFNHFTCTAEKLIVQQHSMILSNKMCLNFATQLNIFFFTIGQVLKRFNIPLYMNIKTNSKCFL